MSSIQIQQTSRPSYSDLGSDFTHLADVVAMVSEHMVANVQRIRHPTVLRGGSSHTPKETRRFRCCAWRTGSAST